MESRKLFVDGKETEFPTKFPHLCTEEKNVRNHFRPKNPQNLTIHVLVYAKDNIVIRLNIRVRYHSRVLSFHLTKQIPMLVFLYHN